MNTKENKNNEFVNFENNKNELGNKIWRYILSKIYYAGLVLIILIICLWALTKISILKNNYETDKSAIINKYELKLDSLNIDRMQLTAKTLSWALRGELIRDNKEQINQYFMEFVKNPNIGKLQFINAENSIIEISTDKKDEGTINSEYGKIDSQIISTDSIQYKIVTPITGLNKKIGFLIININNLTK